MITPIFSHIFDGLEPTRIDPVLMILHILHGAATRLLRSKLERPTGAASSVPSIERLYTQGVTVVLELKGQNVC